MRSLHQEWLVRISRQRVGVSVQVVVDVSASMAFGARTPKLHVAADFIEALGYSTFRVGDALGMVAFDAAERADLYVPGMIRQCRTAPGSIAGLEQALVRLVSRPGLVFLVSDFHWPLDHLGPTLDLLTGSFVVPMIIWDHAEIEPPGHDAIVALEDAESGASRTLWMRPKLRAQWRENVGLRRLELDRFFASRQIRPFYVTGAFDADAMSEYFFEANA